MAGFSRSEPLAAPANSRQYARTQSKRILGETRCTVAWDADLNLLSVRTFAHAPWPVHDALASVLSRDCRLLRRRYRSVGVGRQAGVRRSLARWTLQRE